MHTFHWTKDKIILLPSRLFDIEHTFCVKKWFYCTKCVLELGLSARIA